MRQLVIESQTAQKNGWGSDSYRSVTRLTADERQAVKDGDIVWFSFTPWHYTQSGYKIVTFWAGGPKYDSREPTPDEVRLIMAQRAAGLHYESPAARAVINPTDWDSYYPEIDEDGYLTGDIIDCTSSDADSYINVGDDVLVREDALSQEQLQDVDEGRMGGIPDEEERS